MKLEQKIGVIFARAGVAAAVESFLVGDAMVGVAIPAVLYAAMAFLASKIEQSKRPKWILTHSVMSFILTWFVSWVFLFNTW